MGIRKTKRRIKVLHPMCKCCDHHAPPGSKMGPAIGGAFSGRRSVRVGAGIRPNAPRESPTSLWMCQRQVSVRGAEVRSFSRQYQYTGASQLRAAPRREGQRRNSGMDSINEKEEGKGSGGKVGRNERKKEGRKWCWGRYARAHN